jgi:hypothetical protein
MGKRNSVKNAIWSVTRKESYQKMCNKIIFDNKIELTMSDDAVYLKLTDKEKLLLHITNPKTMWYEIWLKLKDI